jgi:CHAD domain-containing protein
MEFIYEVTVVVFVLLVDDQQVVLDHVYLPSIVYNKILNNENFDKINRQLLDKMHKVRFHVKMDRYQAKNLYY